MLALEIAQREIGIHEATGKNDGIPAKKYMRGDKLAWCAGFVLYCFDESDSVDVWDAGLDGAEGDDSDYWKLRNVDTMEKFLKERGVWFGWNLPPEPGDIIFFADRGGSDPSKSGRHVGIVESFDGAAIVTVEGNLGNAVKRGLHDCDSPRITGFARLL
jgi:hypothetical protein